MPASPQPSRTSAGTVRHGDPSDEPARRRRDAESEDEQRPEGEVRDEQLDEQADTEDEEHDGEDGEGAAARGPRVDARP